MGKEKSFETFAPIFNGFYETPFGMNTDDASNELIEELSISDNAKELLSNFLWENWIDCIDEKYDDYETDVAVNICEFITNKLNEIFETSINVKFKKIISPKYYNYTNDSIDITVECDVDSFMKELLAIIKSNMETFDVYIKEHYTSYDGFVSFYSNDCKEWLKENYDTHEIGALIDFVLKVKYSQIYDELIYYVKENVYDMYYVSLTDKIQELLKENSFDSIFKEWENALKQKAEYIELLSSQGKQINFNLLEKNETVFKKQMLDEMELILKEY